MNSNVYSSLVFLCSFKNFSINNFGLAINKYLQTNLGDYKYLFTIYLQFIKTLYLP